MKRARKILFKTIKWKRWTKAPLQQKVGEILSTGGEAGRKIAEDKSWGRSVNVIRSSVSANW